MDAKHLTWSPGAIGKLDDRDRGRVTCQDRVWWTDRVQGAVDLALFIELLDNCLDDEIAPIEGTQVTRGGDVGTCGIAVGLTELASFDGGIEGPFDALNAALQRLSVHLAYDGVKAGPGAYFGNAGAHQAAAHYTYSANVHQSLHAPP
jgi:hypothetical protein